MAVHMDYDRVRGLRSEILAAAEGMTAGYPFDASVPAAAFGNVSGASACAEAWRDVVALGSTANTNMRGALDADAVRLDEVIACFQSTDHESADEICAAPRSATVMSAHLHSHDKPLLGDGPGPAWDDYLRATQHDRLVDYAAGRSGPVIVGVDANVSVDRDEDGQLAEYTGELAPEAVERFEDEGFESAGDFSGGEPGVGTSSSDKSIDYVWSRGLDAGAPRRVEGDPSDHDGQRVDFDIPRW